MLEISHADRAPPRREARTLDDADRLASVLAAHPNLAGFGWRTKLHNEIVFTQSRGTLRDAAGEFARALEFFRAADHAIPASSYAVKHLAEQWHRERYPKQDSYISNGALIAAALALGLNCKPLAGTPNSRIAR